MTSLNFYYYFFLATLGLSEVTEVGKVCLWSWSMLWVSRPARMEFSWLEAETWTELSTRSNCWESLAGARHQGFLTLLNHLVSKISQYQYQYQVIILLQTILVFTTWTDSSLSVASPQARLANTPHRAGGLGLTSTLTLRMINTRWFTLTKLAQSCQEGI